MSLPMYKTSGSPGPCLSPNHRGEALSIRVVVAWLVVLAATMSSTVTIAHEPVASGKQVQASDTENQTNYLSVKLFVDDDEPSSRAYWEPRLRQRLEWASDVLEQHCRLRLEVIAAET